MIILPTLRRPSGCVALSGVAADVFACGTRNVGRPGRGPLPQSRRGFTLSEVLIATAIGGILLTAVLAANLHVARSSLRGARYAELEPQIRRGLETIGTDLRVASGLVLNGPSDITLTVPDSSGATTQVTYAWTSASSSFFRVAGGNSTITTGRIYLIRDLPTANDGTSGVTFERLNNLGAAATTDLATKQIRIRVTAARGLGSGAAATRYESAAFMLRNKPTS
jgi:prepilin-type N-terminal cleavage/methylation domain-containing protein